MTSGRFDPGQHLPLKAADFQVLLVLCGQPLHAYGICKAVEDQLKGQVRLEIGSLYRMMGRLTTVGLIEETEDASASDGDTPPERRSPAQRRKTYRITEQGRQVARAEARRLQEVLEVAHDKDLLTESGGA